MDIQYGFWPKLDFAARGHTGGFANVFVLQPGKEAYQLILSDCVERGSLVKYSLNLHRLL